LACIGQSRLTKGTGGSAPNPLFPHANHHGDAELVCEVVKTGNLSAGFADGAFIQVYFVIGVSDSPV
jgi:hypothetical protein